MGMSDYVRGLRDRVGHDLLFTPSAACLIRDGDQRILFVQHVEGRWTFPAGAVDPGESPADAARREAWEEAGILVEPYRLAGVYGGGPSFEGTYANGDRVAWITSLFECRIVSGEAEPHDDETADVCWAHPEEALALDLSPSTRHMLVEALAERPFGAAAWEPPS